MSEDDAVDSDLDAENRVESGSRTGSGIANEAPNLSEWTREWLEERAAEQDVPPGELLERFAAAFRAAEEGDVPNLAYQDDLDALDDELAALASDLDGLENSVAELDADVVEKIQDVRERVIQVKREADAKAPADHRHPDLAEQVSSVAETAAATQDRLDDLSRTVDGLDDEVAELDREIAELDVEVGELDATVDSGFENFEDILEYLTDAVDEVEARNEQLAGAIVSMRETVQGVAEREGRRIAADNLRETANKNGIRTADCGDCGAGLDVALLTDARCPHCKSTFANLEPRRGFFGSATLEVGDRPALEAADVDEADSLAPSSDLDAVADGNGRSVGDRSRGDSDTAANGTDIRPGSASDSGEDEDR